MFWAVAVPVVLICLPCICLGFWLFFALAIPISMFFLWVFLFYFVRLTGRFGILYIAFFGFGFCLPGLPCGVSSPALPGLLGELMWFYFSGKANH